MLERREGVNWACEQARISTRIVKGYAIFWIEMNINFVMIILFYIFII